jgi:opacity protein-like surface antigen
MKFQRAIYSTFYVSLLLAIVSLGIVPKVAHSKDGYYVGINVGGNWTGNGTSGSSVAGAADNGFLSDIDGDRGLLLGGSIGYRYSDLLRVDISYSRLKNQLSWQGNYPVGDPTLFSADTTSDLFMLNGSLHGKGIWPESFNRLDPFISAGVGYARNSITHAVETDSVTGGWVSNPTDGTSNGIAFRLGLGLDYELNPNLTLTTSVDANWLGSFETGNFRVQGPTTPAIGPWMIDDVIAVGASIGLRYSF